MTRKKLLLILLAPLLLGAAFQFGGIRHDITSNLTSAFAVVLSTSSTQVQRFTGSTAQVVKLPDATGLRSGYWYTVINESTAALTVSNSGSTALYTLSASSQTSPKSATFYVTSTATAGGPWSIDPGNASGGSSEGPRSQVTWDGAGSFGSTNTTVPRMGNQRLNVGTDITCADSATLGFSCTVNTDGLYAWQFCTAFNGSGTIPVGTTVNGSALTTSIASTDYSQGLRGMCQIGTAASNNFCCVSWSEILTAGDVVRPGSEGSALVNNQKTNWNIIKLSD